MLLLADKNLTEQIASRIAGRAVVAVADPYDALEKMAHADFPLVVLSPTVAGPSAEGEFAALCRASRRLQRHSRLVALCPPRLEAEVRALVGEALDDYFITPPSQADLRTLTQAGAPAPASSAVQPLSSDEISRLVGATFSPADLQTALAQMVAAKVHAGLEWTDEPAAPNGAQVLLRLDGKPARVLVAACGELGRAGPAVDVPPQVQAMLSELRRLLPALLRAARRSEALHHLAITDDLTGAYNRRYFYHATDHILRQAAAKNWRVTLLLYDIDDFKSYNDQYSYAVGDEILKDMAELMRRTIREHDIVARIGGDEFAVLFWDRSAPRLPDSKPPEDALVLSRRFLAALERHEFPSLGPAATGVLTISGGLASFPVDGATCRELLHKADKALKTVKRAGKRGIRIIGPASS